MTFDTLGLRPESLRAVADQGYDDPTPIQAQAIPVILDGRDLLAGAQTGTGKTAAFVLPVLQTLHANRGPGPKRVRALVVVPTRELALQVEQSVRTYGAHRPVRSTTVFGGIRMDRQVRALRKGVEIVVATPGRLLDHVRQGTIDLGHVEILVLDEADRMLDMGFLPDIKRILEQLPRERQSLLFSATFSPRIRALAKDFLRQPESIDVAPRNATAAPVRQLIHPVDKGRKRHLLSHMVRSRRVEQVLVFTRTKRGANRLAEQLGKDGIDAGAIHGNKSQSQRVKALTAFKQGHSQVLVATDIAARGLDIDSLPHVVNYELPTVPEDYVHRIGRTGRAGQEGTAISLVSADEQDLMLGIEKLLKRPIDREVVEGFEPQMAFRPEPIVTRRPNHGRGRPRQQSDSPSTRQGGGAWASGRGKPAPAARRGRSGGPSDHVNGRGSEPRHGAPNQALPGERLTGHRSAGTPQGGHRSAGDPRRGQHGAGTPRRGKRSRDGVPQWEARGRRSRRS